MTNQDLLRRTVDLVGIGLAVLVYHKKGGLTSSKERRRWNVAHLFSWRVMVGRRGATGMTCRILSQKSCSERPEDFESIFCVINY